MSGLPRLLSGTLTPQTRATTGLVKVVKVVKVILEVSRKTPPLCALHAQIEPKRVSWRLAKKTPYNPDNLDRPSNHAGLRGQG